ncbi:MAG: serine/threonine-protein kinase [Chloroflexota bacterium]
MHNLAGSTFGRFNVEQLLGMGGFAVVYKAFDTDNNQDVVLKILHRRWSNHKNIINQFIKEGQTLSKLSHPNVIKLYNVETLYGQPFYVMEYLPGVPLSDILSGESLTPILPVYKTFIYDILSQIAEALNYLHSKKIIHRDIKPSNIFIADDYTAKLLDFGCSQHLLGLGLQEKDRTGTLKYMSPEQKAGKRINEKSDIYSFGLTIQEILEKYMDLSPEKLNEITRKALELKPKNRVADPIKLVDEICSILG